MSSKPMAWTTVATVVIAAGIALFGPDGMAGSDPEGLRCIDRFLAAFDSLSGYRTRVSKSNYFNGVIQSEEQIDLRFQKSPELHRFEFLNEGSTGIKNNGMTVEYSGGDKIRVRLGNTSGLGFLVKGVASLVFGEEVSLFEPQVLEDEYLTVNRAGFTYLAYVLRFHRDKLRDTKNGGVTVTGPGCQLRYSPHTQETSPVRIRPADSIRALEERFGTLAYLIYFQNRGVLKDFNALFNRGADLELSIPAWFFDFEMRLDPTTFLPKFLSFSINSKIIQGFSFSETARFIENAPAK